MRKPIAVAFSLVVLQMTAAAGASAQEEASREEALARELLEVSGAGAMGLQVVRQMAQSFAAANPDVPQEFWDRFVEEVDPEELEALVLPIYTKHLTVEEMEATIAFYRTPVGQSILQKMPVVVAESIEAGQRWGMELAQRAMEKLEARDAATHSGDRGVVEFGVSCSEAVQDDFDQALALLHHMMYEQARQELQRITERAPECAMAYWGVAVTRFQPLWPTRPDSEALAAGHREVQKAIELGPGSERERALVAAAEAFFREPDTATWWTRIHRWADAMESAYRAHGEDLDVAALYALSRLAVAPRAEDRMAEHAEAAQVLLEVYRKQPRHPGAIHYTIHANDMSGRAGESLEVVRSYGEVAPDVAHALHMPTHIFVRLGEWPEVIEWNRRSAAAALRHPAGDRVSHHYPHATDYLLYAHLQRAEDERAQDVLEETLGRDPYQDSFISAFHLAVMPARYAIERRDWNAAARIQPREPAGLSWDAYSWPEAMAWLARGLGSVHGGALDEARAAEKRIIALESKAREAGEETMARYIEIDRRILSGFITHAEGDDGKAVELLRTAAELEGTVEKHPVSPGALLPPYEALGDLLLELGRASEALEAYESSLGVWPGRYRSLLGAARAAAAADRPEVARERYAELLGIAGEPAEPRPGLVEARRYVTDEEPGR